MLHPGAAAMTVSAGLLAKDTHDPTIRLAPPLVIEPAEVDWAVRQLEEVLQDLRA